MATGAADKRHGEDARPWQDAVMRPSDPVQWHHVEAPHVLIVEDDAAIRELLSTVLVRQGFRTRAVGTGQEGLAAVADEPVHVLVTDYQLPDMDGLNVLEQATRYDPRIVGIVITGHGTIELAVKAMKTGASDMLTKPFQPNDVVLAIRRVLEVQHLRRENRVLKQAVMRGVRMSPFQLSHIGQGEVGEPNYTREADRGKSPDYLRGLADGERRAKERMNQIQQQEALVATTARQLARACAELPDRIEAEVVTLAFEIARKVVHACAEDKRSLVVEQVKEAVSRIRESKAVRILVHPSDLPLVEEASAQLAEELEGPASIKIEGDPIVARGGCRVQTPTHLVDASLDDQLARIAEGFRQRPLR
ncbi:hypothetical protein YTPLAS18_27540 [Nitrospira sp.]|nr:hypothetical protein YTPLAS18_27540 [Nitrospira sp.]